MRGMLGASEAGIWNVSVLDPVRGPMMTFPWKLEMAFTSDEFQLMSPGMKIQSLQPKSDVLGGKISIEYPRFLNCA